MTEWQCLAFRAAVRFWQLGVFGLCFLRDEMDVMRWSVQCLFRGRDHGWRKGDLFTVVGMRRRRTRMRMDEGC